MTVPGRVYLVGAGPGDPGLITVAGLERLGEADVIVYDRLVNPRLLDQARPGAELIFAGKEGGGPHWDQRTINELLVAKASQGNVVVRLKGGDPFVFGRGGEEAEALHVAGIPFEVVPGVTSAVAVPAYAGIPVTHRGVASSLAVITGHEDPAKEESAIRWDKLATAVDTLVLLMGTKTLPEIVERLTTHGRSADTPAAVIQWGTTPQQRTVVGTLADIVRRVEEAGLTPPAIAVVGEVVRLRDTLSWFENRPLFGKRVLVTRTREQASRLAELLAEEGADPVQLPSIEITEVVDADRFERAIEKLEAEYFDWLIFTSENGVDIFFNKLWQLGGDARSLGATRVAVIGEATAEALLFWGIAPDLVPEEFVAEGLLKAFEAEVGPGQKVLLARAKGARDALIDGLRKQGAIVEELRLYEATVPKEVAAGALRLLLDGGIDIVTFTSSSTVRNLVALLEGDVECLRKPRIACIGPITAKTVAEVLGRPPDVVAAEHTIPGLVAALREKLASSG